MRCAVGGARDKESLPVLVQKELRVFMTSSRRSTKNHRAYKAAEPIKGRSCMLTVPSPRRCAYDTLTRLHFGSVVFSHQVKRAES